ncbi:hypothetical protein V2J09_010064 [Rumex salicifolius]
MEDTNSIPSQTLNDAALQGDVTLLQEFLLRDPLLVHRPSATSALHVACKLGHVQFTWELLRLNPSLAEDLDPSDRSTPLHVASRYGHLDIVRSVVSVSPGACFARDVNGMNPVHVAAVKGHLDVLGELLKAAPAAARERVGVTGESIMQLCVKYKQLAALKAVVGAVGDAEVLNAVDGEGNTVLHVAVANKEVEMVRLLLSDGRVKRNTPNSKGSTPMDIFTQSHKDLLKDYPLKTALKRYKALKSEAIKREKEKDRHFHWLENQRSSLMVVASLIATMAFQAGISPPGGSWQDATNNMTPGAPIMAQRNKLYYKIFVGVNTVGLVSSMSSILLLISGLPGTRFFVALIMVAMWVAISAMTAVYGIGLYALSDPGNLDLVKKIIGIGLLVWLVVMGILLLGHVTWWTIRILRQLGRLVMNLFRCCCCPRRRVID